MPENTIKEELSNPVLVRFANGRSYYADFSNAYDLVLNPAFLRFIAFVVVLLSLNRSARAILPEEFGASIWVIAMIWLLIIIQTMIMLSIVINIIHWLVKRGWLTQIYTIMVLIPVVMISEVIAFELIQLFLLDDQTIPDISLIAQVVQSIFNVLIIDMFFGEFVAPQIELFHPKDVPFLTKISSTGKQSLGSSFPVESNVNSAAASASIDLSVTELEVVVIGREKFLTNQLLSISAEGHYIRVSTQKGNKVLRWRFSDATKQVAGVDGFLISRSCWVSRHAVQDIKKQGRKVQIQLINDEIFTVAQSRQAEILEALKVNL